MPPTKKNNRMKIARQQKETVRRLKIIEGHLKKVRRMVEENAYCVDILQQSLAVQNALRKVEDMILGGHLRTCVIEAVGQKKKSKIEEILALFEKRR